MDFNAQLVKLEREIEGIMKVVLVESEFYINTSAVGFPELEFS